MTMRSSLLDRGIRSAVIGEFARTALTQGGGSSHMNPARLSVPPAEIEQRCEVRFATGYDDEQADDGLIAEAVAAARSAEVAILFVGTTERIECEGYDRADLQLPAAHPALLDGVAAVNDRLVVVNTSGSAVDLRVVADRCSAILPTSRSPRRSAR
jgi:beta-glucosidase